MDFGTPCNLTISLKSSPATLITSIVFLLGIKYVIFEYLSTTTKIESIPHWVCRRPNKKSMEISFQRCSGIGRDMYKPIFSDCPLAVWQVKECWKKLLASCLSWGQQYLSSKADTLLSLPSWPFNPPCKSRINFSPRDVREIHNQLPFSK